MNHIERARQEGMALVELLIGGAALVAVVGILIHFLLSSSEARKYGQRLHLVAGTNQEVLADIQQDLHAAVQMITNDEAGRSFQGLLDVSGAATPIDSSTLPAVESGGIFEREMHAREKTGNALMFGRHAWRPMRASASSSGV